MSRTIKVTALPADRSNNNIQIVFKNCVPFPECISKISNTQTDNARDINVVMLMYDLIEYSSNYSNTSGNLRHYFRDEPDFTDPGALDNFSRNCALLSLNKK